MPRPRRAARPTGRGCRSARRRSRSPTGGRARPGRPGSARGRRGRAAPSATEQVSAADEDSPAPAGHVGVDQHAHPAGQPRRAAVARPRPGSPAQPSGRPGARSASASSTSSPSPCSEAQRQPAVVAPGHRRPGGVRERDRQHEAVVVVGVLADDVDPAGRGPDALGARRRTARRRRSAAAARRVGSRARTTARSCSATSSGFVSVMNAPMPDSEPARYFSLPGARAQREQLQVQPPVVAARADRRLVPGRRCRASGCRSGGRSGASTSR